MVGFFQYGIKHYLTKGAPIQQAERADWITEWWVWFRGSAKKSPDPVIKYHDPSPDWRINLEWVGGWEGSYASREGWSVELTTMCTNPFGTVKLRIQCTFWSGQLGWVGIHKERTEFHEHTQLGLGVETGQADHKQIKNQIQGWSCKQ